MARNEQIAIDITAKDEASPVITKLAKKIDGMEADEARITVTAQTDKLEAQLDRAKAKLDTLSGDEASVQARLIGSIEEDLERANKLLEQLDGQTATVKIDSVGAKEGLDEIGKSADSSKSVLANMVGNATQDLGALGGVAGSAGVAIGQMGEYMADAAASGEGFSSIVKNFAGVGAPIAALSVALIGVQKVMSSIAESKAFDEDQAKAFATAIEEVGEGAQAVLRTIKETQSVTGRAGGLFGSKALEETKDITATLVEAEVGADLFAQAVAKGGAPLDEAIGKLEELKTAAKAAYEVTPTDANAQALADAIAAIEILKETHKTYAAQLSSDDTWANWIADSEAAKTTTDAWNSTLQTGIGWLDGTSTAMGGASDKTKDLAAAYADAKQKANDLTYANQLLRGDLDQHGAYLRLQAQFDETKRKGQEAMDAVKTGASDADEKMRDYELSVVDSKIAVMDFNDEWGTVDTDQQLTMNTQIDRGEFDQVLVDVGKATSTTHWIDVRVRTAVDTAWTNVMNTVRLGGARATLGPP